MRECRAMLVIHGIWVHCALRVWAEDSGQPAAAGSSRWGTVAPLRPHPFAAAAGALADVLAEWPELTDPVRKATEDELTLWLPGTSGQPIGSPDLLDLATGESALTGSGAAGRVRSARPPVGLVPWQLPALSFDPDPALALLTIVGQPDARLADGIVAGSLHYLAGLAGLAADLAARGRVLPGLHAADDGSYAARWRPVLAGADAVRARELTGALPPLCRATSADGEPSALVVSEALELLTDAAVRARLGRGPGFAILRAGSGAPLTDRWAAALSGPDGRLSLTSRDRASAAQLAFALWAWQDAAQEPPG
ncbi:MAG TPA: hypothetical protein VEJ42_08720, partial [Streptosporangiaceae bacterium]|nr:hypothetical protein [Streptosporangiaceae bacterium]